MKEINWNKQRKIFDKVECFIKQNKLNNVPKLFKKLFGNDTNYIHAVVLTESNPEYRMQSKEFNDILYKFYINTLSENINKKLNI